MSSHNLVLARLLGKSLCPLRLVQDAKGGSAERDTLRLEPGVLAHTNGLHMMDNYAFPDSVRATAARVHAQLLDSANRRTEDF